MKKTFCDICGKETKEYHTYTLPQWGIIEARSSKDNALLAKFDKLMDMELEICNECRYNIATVTDKLKQVKNDKNNI